MTNTTETSKFDLKLYFPLALILAYLLGILMLSQAGGAFDVMKAMNEFMAGFFLIFSFFKLLNLEGFAEAYRGYDIIAKRFPPYARVYPFIELALGIAYFVGRFPIATNIANLAVMSVSSIGVITGLREAAEMECACLGTVLKLPMSRITLFEDLIMVAMSVVMLVARR